MKSYLDATLREFLSATAARQPTPGGGSCAALVGAIGAGLGRMAARYTLAGKKNVEHHPAVSECLAELETLERLFRRLIDEDVAAYQEYRDAARNKDESAEARQRYQLAVATAAAVPLEIVSAASSALRTLTRFKDTCTPHLISDLSCAAWTIEAAARAAAENVRINLPQISDSAGRRQLENMLAEQLAHVADLRPKITDSSP